MSTPEQYAETKQMVRQAMQEEGVSAQALIQIGDLAVFLQKHTYEIQFNNQKYLILSQASVLMVLREDY